MYFKQLNTTFKFLLGYFVFCCLTEIIIFSIKQLFGNVNNLPLLHLFTIVEYGFLVYVYFKYFIFSNKLFFVTFGLFIFIAFIDAIYLNSIYKHNTLARPTEGIILIILALYYYYLNLKNSQITIIYKEAMYWFSTAVLIYFSIDFFGFLVINKLSSDIKQLVTLTHAIFNIIAYILYAKAISCFKWKD